MGDLMMPQDRMKGKIKVVNSKGFGFITTDSDIDFFFHYSAFEDGKGWKRLVARFVVNPAIRPEVEFDVDPTATEAPRAINVKLIGN